MALDSTTSAVLSDLKHDDALHESSNSALDGNIARSLAEARAAQPAWAASPLRHRLKVLRRLRHRIAARPDDFIDAVSHPQRRNGAETLAAELLPLADACRWLEDQAATVLAPRTLSRRARPLWLAGVRVTESRDPFGVVLVISTWNYPLFLPGVQIAQALAAGNAVLLKPGRDGTAAAEALRDALFACGLDRRLLTVLPEAVDAARAAIGHGVDKVVLTGAAETGRKVLSQLADTLTPADMELSGCDAVFVRGDADLDLVVKALAFATLFNGGATCIAPRRVFVHRSLAADVEARLTPRFAEMPPVAVEDDIAARLDELLSEAAEHGARLLTGGVERSGGNARIRPMLLGDVPSNAELLKADILAPVLSLITVDSDEQAIRLNSQCPYALGATVFGRSEPASDLAAKLDAGCVVVNDVLVPTADPRVAFGGRRQSGFGVTRGAAGLLAMTQPKTVIEQTSNWRPHLEPPTETDESLMRNYLAAAHGRNWRDRLRAAFRCARDAYKMRRSHGD
ncbi:MAG: aldehyde dehydrogenase family protein [Planctomycetota bacterium]|nr:aldehyde dehydrogenase family protein [Planctomycetaceae bacterium]MDQ3329941.1 aldehyde dehydrogenase family protein [Planctomycetota bacterium]